VSYDAYPWPLHGEEGRISLVTSCSTECAMSRVHNVRDRATHYVSWNFVNSCTVVWKIAFKTTCSRWI